VQLSVLTALRNLRLRGFSMAQDSGGCSGVHCAGILNSAARRHFALLSACESFAAGRSVHGLPFSSLSLASGHIRQQPPAHSACMNRPQQRLSQLHATACRPDPAGSALLAVGEPQHPEPAGVHRCEPGRLTGNDEPDRAPSTGRWQVSLVHESSQPAACSSATVVFAHCLRLQMSTCTRFGR
jgi:hypothetical protein